MDPKIAYGKLADMDFSRNGSFVQTFLSWVENGFSQAKGAEALGIHKNTMMVRMNKIVGAIGWESREFRKWLDLYIYIRSAHG